MGVTAGAPPAEASLEVEEAAEGGVEVHVTDVTDGADGTDVLDALIQHEAATAETEETDETVATAAAGVTAAMRIAMARRASLLLQRASAIFPRAEFVALLPRAGMPVMCLCNSNVASMQCQICVGRVAPRAGASEGGARCCSCALKQLYMWCNSLFGNCMCCNSYAPHGTPTPILLRLRGSPALVPTHRPN